MIQATKVNHVLIKGKRYYEIPGKTTLYPSTTTILSNLFVKPQLETWQRNTSLKDYHERLMKHSPVVNTGTFATLMCQHYSVYYRTWGTQMFTG